MGEGSSLSLLLAGLNSSWMVGDFSSPVTLASRTLRTLPECPHKTAAGFRETERVPSGGSSFYILVMQVTDHYSCSPFIVDESLSPANIQAVGS